jgi:acyl-homoserine lactone acylase PvdQ
MELHTNSSNNTLLADALGNIAYYHSNYIPRRNVQFDWTKPVDGSDPATDYKGVLSVAETPHLVNPPAGWVYNSNDWPWDAAGVGSLDRNAFPMYVEAGGPSARGAHAIRVLSDKHDFTLAGLIDAAYDSYQTWFPKPIAALTTTYWNAIPADHPLRTKVAEQIAMLKAWNFRASESSVETSLAIYWGEAAMRLPGFNAGTADPVAVVQALANASDKLTADFGSWKTPWGEINRFQRLTDDIVHPFTDAGPSIPVGFTSATWGSLASFGARSYNGSKKRYGTSGNSFVAAVEFGADSVRARAVTAGGESGDPKSPHFNDQAKRYATGNLRQVYYYPSQLKGHTEKVYHPGEK